MLFRISEQQHFLSNSKKICSLNVINSYKFSISFIFSQFSYIFCLFFDVKLTKSDIFVTRCLPPGQRDLCSLAFFFIIMLLMRSSGYMYMYYINGGWWFVYTNRDTNTHTTLSLSVNGYPQGQFYTRLYWFLTLQNMDEIKSRGVSRKNLLGPTFIHICMVSLPISYIHINVHRPFYRRPPRFTYTRSFFNSLRPLYFHQIFSNRKHFPTRFNSIFNFIPPIIFFFFVGIHQTNKH